jgi:hypothetical protein
VFFPITPAAMTSSLGCSTPTSIPSRGKAAAAAAGLLRQLRFLPADATLAKNYRVIVPVDLIILSGVIGHLRIEDVPRMLGSLPMLCKSGGCFVWNRHLVLNHGREQVPAIREYLQRLGFEELDFETTAPDGFAVGRARYTGEVLPLDTERVLFEFVGLDCLCPQHPARANQPAEAQRLGDRA